MYETLRSYRQIESALMVPTQPWWLAGAAVDMDFSNGRYYGGTLSELMSTSRASTGYATNGDGTLTSFANDTPRIGVGTGLLVEEARTNLITKSQVLSDAAWVHDDSTGSAAPSIVGPDGSSNVFKLTEGSGAGIGHQTYQLLAPVAGTYTTTYIVKAAERNWIIIYTNDSTSGLQKRVWFNLATGTVGTSQNGAIGRITPLANGFYACSVTATTIDANYFPVLGLATGDAVSNYNGDGSSGVYVFNGQGELGAFGTSPIITTTVAVTRAGDVVTLTGAALTSVKLASASSFAFGGPTANSASFPRIIGSGPSEQALPFAIDDVAGIYNGSVSLQTAAGVGATIASVAVKIACAWAPGDRAVVKGGATVATDANSQLSEATYYLGSSDGAFNWLDGYIRRVALWNSRLPNATLQALTVA